MDLRAAAIEAARRNNLDPNLFLRLIQQESGFRPDVTSSAGAYGPAQLMPGTAADLGVDPRDPLQNLEGGARYLRQQMDTFGDPRLALAAYNAGPGAVRKYGGVPPFKETQNYVASILGGQGGGNVTRSSKGTTGMGLLDMPAQQPQTFGQKIGEGFRSGELFDQLALAFNSLRMNPDQNLAAMVGQRQEMRGQEQAANRTAQWLSSIGRDDLAQAMLAGSLDPQSAAAIAMTPADPMDAINLQKAQLELQNLQNPQPEFRRATPEEASAYGAQGGQFGPDGRFYAVDVPQGMTIESDGAGGFRMVQGAGAGAAKPFTEGQSKDIVYATRAAGALEVLEPVAGELTSLGSQMAGSDPTGIIRGRVQSPEYQIARNAGDEFLQAILRKDTGAAITAGEQALYGTTYLPQPGDGPEVLDAKRMARQRAVAAITAGMSPVQIIATEKALGSASAPAAGGVVTITSDAEYEALPSGTTFISPDGKTRRKP